MTNVNLMITIEDENGKEQVLYYELDNSVLPKKVNIITDFRECDLFDRPYLILKDENINDGVEYALPITGRIDVDIDEDGDTYIGIDTLIWQEDLKFYNVQELNEELPKYGFIKSE